MISNMVRYQKWIELVTVPAETGGRHAPERQPDRFVIYHLVTSSNLMGEAAGFRMDK